jgi:outer membrane beta-barrel protein
MIRKLWVVVLILSLSPSVRATEEEQMATFAVQKRKYRLGHELNVQLGTLPLNAFTKGVTLGGSYTYHFTDTWAWEIAQFIYSFGVDTDLKDQLLNNFMVQPTQIESVNFIGASNVLLKPLYGKYSLTNKWVVHTEAFIEAGFAFAKYINPGVFRYGFDAGLGFRLFLQKYTSLRLDVRDYVFFKGKSPQNELYIALSLALSFGRGE